MLSAKFLLVLVLIITIIGLATADASCWLGDTICKSITCRSCKLAECLNGSCMCTLCS